MGIGQGLFVVKAYREGTGTTDARRIVSGGIQTSSVLSDTSFVWAATATFVERWNGANYVAANVTLPGGVNLFQAISFPDGSTGAILSFSDGASTDSQNITLNVDALRKMATLSGPPAIVNSYRNFVDAFIEGGRINVTLGPHGTLRLHLRGLLTGDYLLDNNILRPAHHPSAASTTNNCTLIGGETDGAFTISLTGYELPDSVAPLGSASGVQNNITLDVGDASPTDSSSSVVMLSVQRSFSADESDTSINASSAMCEVPIHIHVPTELLIVLDRSGSMNSVSTTAGVSKWSSAIAVSNLFSHLYSELVPNRTAVSGSLLSKNSIKFGHFRWSGGLEVVFEPMSGSAFAAASTQPTSPVGSPGGGTPIGMALEDAGAQFTANKWARRLLLLLTDGMDNLGTPSLADLSATQLKALSGIEMTPGDPEHGVILHALSYAKTGETDVGSLADKASDRNGAFHTTATGFDSYAPDALLRAYLGFLRHVLPAEYSTYTGAGIVAEAGLDKLVLVTTHNPGASTLVAVSDPSGTPVEVSEATGDSVSGFFWVSIPNPVAGIEYGLRLDDGTSLPAGSEIHAFYDLSVRTRFGVEASEIGKPVKLWARATFNGRPIEGADIRAALATPGESDGELTTRFVSSGGLMRAVQRGTLNVQHLAASLVATNLSVRKAKVQIAPASANRMHSVAAFDLTHAVGVKVDSQVDLAAVRAQLLVALEAERNLDFQYDRYPIKLVDKGRGLYEYEIPADAVKWAGIYTADFRADGFAGGAPFARNTQVSRVVAEPPSQELSGVSVIESTPQSGNWIVTIRPVNARGLPLGPGLAHFASFHYLNEKDRENTELTPLLTQDNLDGSYSTRLRMPVGKVPEVALFFGNPDAGAPVIVATPKPQIYNVRIVLNKIEVVDDRDPCFKGAGELVFTTSVAPNGSPARTVRARFPEKGHLSIGSGQSIELGEVIYEGQLEKEDALFLSIAGEELDWPRFFDHNDKLTRYIRSIPVPEKTTKYSPDDEPNDPESLSDWKIWYTVEVS